MTVVVSFFRVLEKYYVGELIDNEMPVFPQQRYVSWPSSVSHHPYLLTAPFTRS